MQKQTEQGKFHKTNGSKKKKVIIELMDRAQSVRVAEARLAENNPQGSADRCVHRQSIICPSSWAIVIPFDKH